MAGARGAGLAGAVRCWWSLSLYDGWPAGWSHSSNLLPIWTDALPTIQLVRATNHCAIRQGGGGETKAGTGLQRDRAGKGASGLGC